MEVKRNLLFKLMHSKKKRALGPNCRVASSPRHVRGDILKGEQMKMDRIQSSTIVCVCVCVCVCVGGYVYNIYTANTSAPILTLLEGFFKVIAKWYWAFLVSWQSLQTSI